MKKLDKKTKEPDVVILGEIIREVMSKWNQEHPDGFVRAQVWMYDAENTLTHTIQMNVREAPKENYTIDYQPANININ